MNKTLFADPFFIGLLLRKGPGHAESLLQLLTDQEIPSQIPEAPFSLPAYIEPYDLRLARVHISWLNDSISRLSTFEKRILDTKENGHWIGMPFKKKIQESLWVDITTTRPHLLPFNLCRPDVLIPLMKIPVEKFETTWFMLGLRDLASSFKKIIDARIIRLIQSSLSSKEQEMLKIYSQEKELVTFPKMNLHPELTEEQLREMIFERGINRMSKGFKELGPDALWHFSRYLPKAYGIKLQQLAITSIPSEISQILFQQAYEMAMQGGSP